MKKTLHIQPNVKCDRRWNQVIRREIIRNHPAGRHPIRSPNSPTAIPDSQPVIKYGQPIGQAAGDIEAGRWIHSHNLKTRLSGTLDYQYDPVCDPIVKRPRGRSVMAYRRANGKVGIRNELWVIVTVGCIGDTARNIVNAFRQRHPLDDIDGIFTFNHPFGCSQMGQDHRNASKFYRTLSPIPMPERTRTVWAVKTIS